MSIARCGGLIVTLVGLSAGVSVAVEPPSTRALWEAALECSKRGDSTGAIARLTEVLARADAPPEAYYARGRERFRAAQVAESLADFDQFVKLRPELASRQWERGISCYYAGEYAAGEQQFRDYQTYHSNDVENAVWRYLCMARREGVERARQELLPIAADGRIPMMQIYALYRGQGTIEDVFQAVAGGEASAAERAGREFYARLYVGLYQEAAGDEEAARKYLLQAAAPLPEQAPVNRYMHDVARVHAARWKQDR